MYVVFIALTNGLLPSREKIPRPRSVGMEL